MAEKPVPSENDPQNDEQTPLDGWHEPPVEEGSSRPVPVESWYAPENAVPAETTPPDTAEPGSEELPGTTPEQAGAWYTPIDAGLEALLSSAADTIAEVHEPEQPPARALQNLLIVLQLEAQLVFRLLLGKGEEELLHL